MGSKEPNAKPSIEASSSDASRDKLWKDALVKEVEGTDKTTALVQMTGLESKQHTVFARVVSNDESNPQVTIGKVIEVMVNESYDFLVHNILEKKEHIEKDSYPPSSELLRLGAVWLLNEADWQKGRGAHAHRLGVQEELTIPNWKDMTLRVHYMPDRFHVAHEFDWTKYCRGLLIGGNVEVSIAGETPHVPVSGLPNAQDGVIVYENMDLGFAVLNKPGAMPAHPTISNHSEDVVDMYSEALKQREKELGRSIHVSLPQRMDAERDIHGLLVVATRREFYSHMSEIKLDHLAGDHKHGVQKKYRCLVAVQDPDTMDTIETMYQKGTIVTHYVDPKQHKSPQKFERAKPNESHKGHRDWLRCQLRITSVGDEHLRAACVSSKYDDFVDTTLAHRLWGVDAKAEDLGVSYVMQLEVEPLTGRTNQIRGQLAAMGLPIVGDEEYGGGVCQIRQHEHGWNRLALQCCEVSFLEPKWEEKEGEGKEEHEEGKKHHKHLVPSDRQCFFRLSDAWWTEFLENYKMGI